MSKYRFITFCFSLYMYVHKHKHYTYIHTFVCGEGVLCKYRDNIKCFPSYGLHYNFLNVRKPFIKTSRLSLTSDRKKIYHMLTDNCVLTSKIIYKISKWASNNYSKFRKKGRNRQEDTNWKTRKRRRKQFEILILLPGKEVWIHQIQK